MMARTDRKNDRTDWVISPPGEIHLTLGGEHMVNLTKCMEPSPEDFQHMLLALRKVHRWSQGFTASVFGVCKSTIVKWESSSRTPTGSAAKLIFLLYSQLVERKDRVRNVWDLAVWGKIPCRSEDVEKLTKELVALNPTFFVPEEQVLKNAEKALE